MKLNLREIIEIPGGSVPFAQELDTALLDFPSVRAYTAPITAEGKVVNTAGILRCLRSTETGSMWTRCSPPASSSAWIPSACASPTVPDCATAAART